MKVYYFLNNLSQKNYSYFLDKLSLISNIGDIDNIIKKYNYKIWLKNEWTIQNSNFIEAFMFLKYFLKSWYWKISDIEWVSKKNFLIYNDDIYVYENRNWFLLDCKVIFATCRDGWQSQFFIYLYNKQKYDKKIVLIKPDYIKDWLYRDKLYFISKIQKFRKKYIWDIVIPFIMDNNKEAVLSMLFFIKYRFWDKFVIKSSIWIMWQWVRALKYSYLKEDNNSLVVLIDKFFPKKVYNYNCPYLIPYYNIKKEFRIYYTYWLNSKINIYSVKNRVNIMEWDLFKKADMTYNNIKTIWNYNKLDDFYKNDSKVYNISKKIIKLLWLETGVLELCELENWKIRFLEVNPLWWSLTYPWDDEENIKNFYLDIWNNQFEKLKFT